MAEASEGAEKMHKDGQNQESEADGQKQDDERPPTRRDTSMSIS
jgi:U2 small nuclear ribonucleoprotein A'